MDDRPIGVFDSGFGGLTVARALIDLLPNEELVYAGDSGRYPYGQRPHEQIRNFAEEISTYLGRQLRREDARRPSEFSGLCGARTSPISLRRPRCRRHRTGAACWRRAQRGTAMSESSGRQRRSLQARAASVPGVAQTPSAVIFGRLSRLRRIRRTWRDRQHRVSYARRRPVDAGPGTTCRHAAPRVHALPVPLCGRSATSSVPTSCLCPRQKRPPSRCAAFSSRWVLGDGVRAKDATASRPR